MKRNTLQRKREVIFPPTWCILYVFRAWGACGCRPRTWTAQPWRRIDALCGAGGLAFINHTPSRLDVFAFEFHSISYTELIDLPLSMPIRAFSVFGRAIYRAGIEKRLYGQTELIFIVLQLLRRRCLRRSRRRIPGFG